MRKVVESETYYVYEGSYDGKNDNPECVIWIVFPIPIPITSEQV